MTIEIGHTKQNDRHWFIVNINGKLFSTVERGTFQEARVTAAQQVFNYLLTTKEFLVGRAEE
jgi:hypothetical protein